VHSVPIIENTARECELTDRLRAAIQAYPQANAVLVRRHGVYVWGKNWIEAKTQASMRLLPVIGPRLCGSGELLQGRSASSSMSAHACGPNPCPV
jgi:hypothetical protein